MVGARNPILNIPLHDDDKKPSKIKLPLSPKEIVNNVKYSFQPVVEWCMQNQRLRSAYHAISAIDEGMDLLSNQIWSPSDRALVQMKEAHWLHPYLDDDVNEWTDMTGVLRMERDRVMLPDGKWIWANDWTVDLPGDCGQSSDADGWEYSKDFKSFGQDSRYFQVGDTCRRRRWTRTRLIKPPKLDDPLRPLDLVWTCSKSSPGKSVVTISSQIAVYNETNLELSVLGYSPSWEHDQWLGDVNAGDNLPVPLHLSCLTHVRIAVDMKKRKKSSKQLPDDSLSSSDHILMIPKSSQSQSIFRSSIVLGYKKSVESGLPQILHFSIKLACSSGCIDLIIHPIVSVVNLLPCPLQFRLFEGDSSNAHEEELGLDERILDEQTLDIGFRGSSVAVDSTLNPCVSFRVPGYRWSKQQRIVNRKLARFTWRPTVHDEINELKSSDRNENVNIYTTLIHFDRLTYGGDALEIILEVVPGDIPLLRVYAQFWIVDKTGFGLRFCDGLGDMLGSTLKTTRPRRSYLLEKEMQNQAFLDDMAVHGHEWTIGMKGMTFFFSNSSRLAISIDFGNLGSAHENMRRINSNWSKLVDISNAIPKAVVSLTEFQGERQFDLSYDVAIAPSIFSRTKVVTIYNRFHLVNLSENPFYVKQKDFGMSSTIVPPKCTVPFHWESKTLQNKVQLSIDNRHWTPGSIQLDNVGVSALRLPNDSVIPSVVQSEVRLAKNNFDCAVTVLIWNADDEKNPLFKIMNKSSHNILCNQSHDDQASGDQMFNQPVCNELPQKQAETCIPKTTIDLLSNGLNCGMIESDYKGTDCQHFTWNVKSGTTAWFGFDNSSKSHTIEWTCEELRHENNSKRPNIEVDAVGSRSEQILPSGKKIGCTIRADDCTKVIEFFDIEYNNGEQHPVLADLRDKFSHHEASLSLHDFSTANKNPHEVEAFAFRVKVNIPGVHCSIIENASTYIAGREIFLLVTEEAGLTISHTRDDYQELELKLLAFQIDNHIKDATHPVMVRCFPYNSILQCDFIVLTRFA